MDTMHLQDTLALFGLKALVFLFRFFLLSHALPLFFNNGKGPLYEKIFMALNGLLCRCAFKPSFIHSFIHSFHPTEAIGRLHPSVREQAFQICEESINKTLFDVSMGNHSIISTELLVDGICKDSLDVGNVIDQAIKQHLSASVYNVCRDKVVRHDRYCRV